MFPDELAAIVMGGRVQGVRVMVEALGLSIGTTNLVAARVGRPPVMRRSVLTLFSDRAPEVGLPGENPALGRPGLVLTDFVERVGDPVPLIAEDGSSHRGERVLVEALDAMAQTVGGGSPVAIAVPAHWGPAVIGALRGALRDRPNLAPDGVPAALIPDSVAALTALHAAPGLPTGGVIALVDLGGSGTSITLADGGANFAPIGETVRYADFSGDQIDQAVLNHVIAGVADANNADPAGTAAVGSLTLLRDESRQAKERLSSETATVVPVDLPGFQSDVRLTRTELENLIALPLAGLLGALGETLERNNVAGSNIAAVATVGGGAGIPLITQRLSEQFRVPVITTPQSQLNVAAGAALLADRALAADAPTGLSAAADTPTGIAPAAWAAWAAGAAGLAASESAADGAPSATFRALAWSQDDDPGSEPVPYTGADYTASVDTGPTDARPPVAFTPGEEPAYEAEPAPLPWYKRPPLLFGAAAVAALLAIGGLAVTLTSNSGVLGPVTETSTTLSVGPSPGQPPTSVAPQTVTVTGSDGQPSTTVITPPPPPPTTTTTTSPTTTSATTTTTTATTTTTTTTITTTTTTTTSPPPPPQPEPEPVPEPEPEPPAGGQ